MTARSAREITSGGGHAGGQAGWWHFGLARRNEAEISCPLARWPGNRTGIALPPTAFMS